MKKIILFLFGALLMTATSCSDMLEVENSRSMDAGQSIDKKSDSLYYAWGVMYAMQQAADMYVLQNEVRGDLLSTTSDASAYLNELAEFRATKTNKYDSAYVYYAVVNNCNNYIAHRDTTLKDGADNVTLEEYASILTFRAWAYLQLARTYGSVKFYTTPLSSISEIEAASASLPSYNWDQMVDVLAPELEKMSRLKVEVPHYGGFSAGTTNSGDGKGINSKCLYIPVDVMLGEMYLEAGRYMDAAKHYYTYLYDNKVLVESEFESTHLDAETVTPSDFPIFGVAGKIKWYYNFGQFDHIVSYIPMAVNRLKGTTSYLPEIFGYDFYSRESREYNRYVKPQVIPSAAYNQQADSTWYYYTGMTGTVPTAKRFKIGDQRRWARLERPTQNEDAAIAQTWYPTTYQMAIIYLYRTSTIWLHLAEALNRAGYPDAAFAILKEGISKDLLTNTVYVSQKTKDLLTDSLGGVPFLHDKLGATVFDYNKVGTGRVRNYGIHMHGTVGSGQLSAITGGPAQSLYQYQTVIDEKVAELNVLMGEALHAPTMADDSLFVNINAVEDLLCDEYAMELAFEGSRFADLMRMAKHKDDDRYGQYYGANFGRRWLEKKMKKARPAIAVDLSVPDNWYLPN